MQLVRASAMRRLIRMRSSSVSSGQRVTSSNVRWQLRHTSSPSAVVQCPTQGHSAVISCWIEAGRIRRLYRWPCFLLQFTQPLQRMFTRVAAHFCRRLQPGAKCRTLRLAEYLAAQLFIQLRTRNFRRFTTGHAGQGRGNRGCDTAGGAAGAANTIFLHRGVAIIV